MPKIGDGLRRTVDFDGLTIGNRYFPYPIVRLSESEQKRAIERAQTVQRCRLSWCNNVLVPGSFECAFHLAIGAGNLSKSKEGVVEVKKTNFPKSRRCPPVYWAELEKSDIHLAL